MQDKTVLVDGGLITKYIAEGLKKFCSVYRKRVPTNAVRVRGEFTVETKEGTLHCLNGYLAFDSAGWPYPISKSDFEVMYELESESE